MKKIIRISILLLAILIPSIKLDLAAQNLSKSDPVQSLSVSDRVRLCRKRRIQSLIGRLHQCILCFVMENAYYIPKR